jgi:hypothetical protein
MEKELLLMMARLEGTIGHSTSEVSGLRRDFVKMEEQHKATSHTLEAKIDAYGRKNDALVELITNTAARVTALESKVNSTRLEDNMAFVERFRAVWGWLIVPINNIAQKAVYTLLIAALAAIPTAYFTLNKDAPPPTPYTRGRE